MRCVLCCQAALPHAGELAPLLVTTRGMSPAFTVCLGGKALLGAKSSPAKPFADVLLMHELGGEATLAKVQYNYAMQGQVGSGGPLALMHVSGSSTSWPTAHGWVRPR